MRQALAANNFLAAIGNSKGSFIQVNLTADTNLNSNILSQAGGSLPHNNMQPYLPMYMQICLNGNYPIPSQ